ncbi:ABC transporter ATP-binding protein [Cellulomonas citrea]|uniref:ABC transporter ATP-binding protein n=1 Tax=Cellulomonas citrea TaxID=1909423 RepID=UPI0013581726|nr:ABC transporter ATP-binding protein [Cellulomonas citrea]
MSVTKSFGSFLAVDDLDLTIPAGSFFALLGPSGCGKTTTLRMVAGLEQPTSGTVCIGGRDVTGDRAHRRPVNTVFQSYALFPHLTIADNVAFGLRRRRQHDVDAKVKEALDLVELGHLGERKPTQLSGGQAQRVALARAIVNRPELLLLDEPLGALDLKLRRQMQLELKRIQTEVGLTFVHVTHDQEEAMTMADTVAVMNKGKIEQMGPPEELYSRPHTAFVANFLGQSNLAPGQVVGREGDLLLVTVGGATVKVPVDRAVATTGSVLVGVRPEKIGLLIEGQEPSPNHNVVGPGIVTDVSFTGVSTQYQVEVEHLGTFGVFSQNLLGGATVTLGTKVRLAWSQEFTFGLDGDQDAAEGAADLDAEP